jgi:hypothetical protein
MQLDKQPDIHGGDSLSRGWKQTLGQLIAVLDLLNHDTEQDFLSIGEKLGEFIAAVNLISSDVSVFANLISGERTQRTSEALTSALTHSREMVSRSQESMRVLSGICRGAGRLKGSLAGLKGSVSTFRMLGVLIRVETARLGSAGNDFIHLADDVKSLATVVEKALNTANLLIPSIERALQNVGGLEEGLGKELPAVVSRVLTSFATFRKVQNTAHNSAVRLMAQYGAASSAFNKLMVSLQFHDITRQQIEHVVDILRRLYSEHDREDDLDRDTAAIVQLQSSQLADAAEKFAAAAAEITQSLDEIITQVLAMSDESRTLSGLSEHGKDSFFLQLEQGCGAILSSLSLCAKAEAATRTTSSDLSDGIGRLRTAIEEIQVIEKQLRRMGMNARIQATQTGVRGNALDVLAVSMQQLALESSQRSESLIEVLGSMSEAAFQLCGHGNPTSESADSGQDGYLKGMRVAVGELQSNERSFARIAQIIARGERLHQDLSATRESFSVGARFAEAIGRAQEMLEEIVGSNRLDLSRDGAQASERGLANLLSHYTMQAERDVHEGLTRRLIGPAQVKARDELSQLPPKKAKELEENVEFF